MKRMLLVLLAALCSIAAFASGTSEPATGDEPVSLTVMAPENAEFPFRDDWLILEYARENSDVEFEMEIVPGSDYATKERLVLAAGSAPEIILKSDTEIYNQYAAEGALLPVSDYLAQMPNLSSLVDTWNLGSELRNWTAADGKWYGAPRINEQAVQNIAWAYRDDYLAELGMDPPETVDQYVTYLSEVRERHPETIGYLNMFNIRLMFMMWGPLFDTAAGWGITQGVYYESDEDRWVFPYATDEFRAMLSTLREIYQAGLMDPETFTADNNQVIAKYESGRVAAFIHMLPGVIRFSGNLEENVGGTYRPAPPPAGPNGAYVPGADRVQWMNVIPARVATDPNRDKILSWFDWFAYGEETQLRTTWGEEGVTYEVVGGEKRFLPSVLNEAGNFDKGKAWADYGIEDNGLQTRIGWDFRLETFNPTEAEYLGTIAQRDMVLPVMPTVKLTAIETEDASLIGTPLTDYADEMSVKFIFGVESLEDGWEDFLTGLDERRMDEYVEIYNNAWTRNK